MLDFFLIKVGVGVSVHHSVLCAGLQMLWCTDMSVRLFVYMCVCVCFWGYVYFLSSMQHKYPTQMFHLFMDWKTESY